MNLNIDISNVNTKPPTPQGEKRYLLQHKEDDDYVLQIDNTSLETFNTCPKSAYYRLVHGRVPPPTTALTYGSAIHEGLEYWYRSPRDHSDDNIRGMLDAATSAFDPSVPIPDNEWRTPDRCHDTLLRYIKHYRDEQLQLLTHDGVPQVEIPFSLPLGIVEFHDWVPSWCVNHSENELSGDTKVSNIHIYWTGKIDLMLKHSGGNWICDHKTTSMLGSTFYKQFELSNQMLGYMWAAQQITGEPFVGLLLNVIAGRKITRTGTPTEFARQFYYYRQDQITEWESNTMTLVSDFISHLARNDFPMTTAWCVDKYGMCKYHDVCSLAPEQRASMLNSDQYTDNTWSPLNK